MASFVIHRQLHQKLHKNDAPLSEASVQRTHGIYFLKLRFLRRGNFPSKSDIEYGGTSENSQYGHIVLTGGTSTTIILRQTEHQNRFFILPPTHSASSACTNLGIGWLVSDTDIFRHYLILTWWRKGHSRTSAIVACEDVIIKYSTAGLIAVSAFDACILFFVHIFSLVFGKRANKNPALIAQFAMANCVIRAGFLRSASVPRCLGSASVQRF